jgi:hypothetical protein
MAVLAVGAALTGAARAAVAGPQVSIDGEPQVVYAWQRNACPDFVPDAPARAFRTADGNVALIAAYNINRFFRGPDLDHLSADCRTAYRGAESTDPAAFDDHDWIAAPYTVDGTTVQALVHDEFWGHRRPDLCPTKTYMACWNNRVTAASSSDGGRTFRRLGLVAAAPYPYDGSLGRHVGYFNPSNIISRDGWYYATLFATQWGAQAAGNCLIRTDRLDDPASWRAWDGVDFTIRFVDPYRDSNFAADKHVCTPVRGVGSPIGSIVRHRASGTYVATLAAHGGFYVSTSSDLVLWSAPRLVMAAPLSGEQGCSEKWVVNYPSLLDPASPERNFESVGDTAWLYFTRFWTKDCGLPMQRDLMRVRVKISG